MKKPRSLTESRVIHLIELDDHYGICLACGSECQGVEPDARNYLCEACGETQVFGVEEILISGMI